MSEEQGLLEAIAADPRNDGLRLIYADWLEDHGDPRYELVRVCQAMRQVPVWSDRYWELKARRNELWVGCPLEWLEATGYDGGYYDPVFRDGVPDRWWERWRLIREFTERWHGVAVPDAGGREEVRQAEERLGLDLPPSVREYVAYAHDLREPGTATATADWSFMLFHCAHYHLERSPYHPAVSLIFFTLSDDVLGVALDDLHHADSPTHFFSQQYEDVEFDDDGVPSPVFERPQFCASTLTLSIFSNLFIELPTAGDMETTLADADPLLARLEADFPIHARFDGADVYEGNEMLVLVSGGRERRLEAIVRRPIPVEAIPDYLFGTDQGNTRSAGILGPEWFRRQQEAEHRRPGVHWSSRWKSVLRRREAERSPIVPQPPPADVPGLDWDDIPF